MSQQTFNKKFNKAFEASRQLISDLQARHSQAQSDNTDFPFNLYAEDLGSFGITAQDAEVYFACVKGLHEGLDQKEYFDNKSVDTLLERAILSAVDVKNLQPHKTAKKRLTDALAELKENLQATPYSWEIHLQVYGFAAQGLPVKVGKFEFYTANKTRLRSFVKRIDELSKISPDPPETKARFVNHIKSEFVKHLSDRPVAKIVVSSVTEKAARAQALRELRSTLDLINFFADLLHNTGNGGRVYMPGEAHRGSAFSPAFIIGEGKDTEGHYSSYMVGPFSAFLLSNKTTKELNRFGFKRASAILSKPEQERTDLERCIAVLFIGIYKVESTATEVWHSTFSQVQQ